MEKQEYIAYPEWTEYRKKRGLDPLGMQNSSIVLYQNLLPGIGNVTLRMRYYGLYAWLTWIYAKRIGDTNPKRWKTFLRRGEALYALISQSEGKETGVAGVIWATKQLADPNTETINIASGTDPGTLDSYFQQEWGVYGLAYGSQLFQIGILTNIKDHSIPVPTEKVGEKLANALSNELGDVLELYYSIIERGTVTRKELKKLATLLPSEIGKDSEERRLYERILFSDPDLLNSPSDTNRRNTLLLVLATAKHLAQTPTSSDLRWVLYTGSASNGTALPLNSAELNNYRKSWWVYQTNDLMNFSYTAILKFVLDVLSEYPDGITLPKLINECVSQTMNCGEDTPATWTDFRQKIGTPKNALNMSDSHSEIYLVETIIQATKINNRCTPEIVWNILQLIATLHNRLIIENRDLKKDFLLDPGLFKSIFTEKDFLDRQANESFQIFLTRLIGDQVIKRHLWVAHKKFRYQGDYTFLIEADDGKVRLRTKDQPIFTNPRLTPAMNFLRDIHLIDENGLTKIGLKVLEAA